MAYNDLGFGQKVHKDLELVRKDCRVSVLTAYPHSYKPRDLSNALLAYFHGNEFEIWLSGNIYLIYIDADAYNNCQGPRQQTKPNEISGDSCKKTFDHDRKRQIDDAKMAQKLLRERPLDG